MQISNIDKDDYFVKNAEFTAWLRDQRGIFFNELESDQARSLFGTSPCHQLQDLPDGDNNSPASAILAYRSFRKLCCIAMLCSVHWSVYMRAHTLLQRDCDITLRPPNGWCALQMSL